jgi:beta-glucosidase
VSISVVVTNSGAMGGEEVVQLYVSDLESSVPVALRSLAGFQRIALAPGERKTVSFTLSAKQMSVIDENGNRVVEPGSFRVCVGGKQPGFSGSADATTTGTVQGKFKLEGDTRQLPL